MATIRTIKPDGTGDFTTLAAWNTFAAAQATADQWAECYGGGNLGEVTLTGWTATPTAVLYPKIYAHSSSRHDGDCLTIAPNAAFVTIITGSITSALPFMVIDGLVLKVLATFGITPAIRISAPAYSVTIVNNLVSHTGGTATRPSLAMSTPAPGSASPANLVANNITYRGSAAPANQTIVDMQVADSANCVGGFVNNTQYVNKKVTAATEISFVNAASSVTNNAIFGTDNPTGVYGFTDDHDAGAGQHIATYSYNADDDGGSVYYGDTHAQTTTAGSFASLSKPFPVVGSVLVNNGTTLAAVTTDAVGTSRPQGVAYDIGALELVPELAPGLSAGLTLTGDASSTFVGLMWTRADTGSFHTDYYVYRSPTGSAPWTNVAVILDDALIFDDTPPTLGIWYYYVHAIDRNDAGNTADSSIIQVNTSLSRNRRHGQERGEFFNRNLQV